MNKNSAGWERRPRNKAAIVLFVLLVLVLIWGAVGWMRYRAQLVDNSHIMGLEYVPFPVDEL